MTAAFLTVAMALVLVVLMRRTHRATAKIEEWPSTVRAVTVDGAMTAVRASRGHAVLLVVYASWCSGCRQEMPFVDELAESYGPRGLDVSALARDDDEPRDYVEWMAGKAPHYEQVRLLPAPAGSLRTGIAGLGGGYADAIPYAAVFDRHGKLVREWPQGGATKEAVEQTVAAALATKTASDVR